MAITTQAARTPGATPGAPRRFPLPLRFLAYRALRLVAGPALAWRVAFRLGGAHHV